MVFTVHLFYPLFVKFVAIKKANDQLQEKLSSGKKTSNKDMFSLSWTIDEQDGRDMYVETISLCELLKDESTDLIEANVARCRLSTLQSKCLSFFVVSQGINAQLHLMYCSSRLAQVNEKEALCCTYQLHSLQSAFRV